ncbi:MAG: DUF2065 domain-containing protein [Gammaproteobacteria bacterium]
MNWVDLGTGVALVLVLEGVLPFLSPNLLKQTYSNIVSMSDQTIRFIGLGSMVIGLVLLTWLRSASS